MSGAGPSNRASSSSSDSPSGSAANEKETLRANSAIPIPSYEEATASRAASEYGETNDAPAASSGMAESSNLLSGYRPPTVESVRNSMDSSFLSDYQSVRSSEESLQREMIQMEIEEAEVGARRNPFAKRFGWSISLPNNPFKGWRWRWRPRWAWARPRMPDWAFCKCTTEAAIVPIARVMIVVLALVMVYGLFASGILSYPNRLASEYIVPQRLRAYATESLDYANIDHWMRYLGSFNHVAGTKGDLVLAKYVERKLGTFGFETERVEIPTYINFPKPGGRRVWMDNPKWEAKIEERTVDKDRDNTLVFHALSKSGTAKGPLVYANHGTREDFARLEQMGIKVEGSIVLMRHGGKRTNDGQKVLAAQEKGAVGCLIFTDPRSDGFGWPIDAVRRASVGLRNRSPGDPLTPGNPRFQHAKTRPKEESHSLVKIPSLPLSWGDAKPLLEALKGIGHPVDESWKTVIPEVFTGDPSKSPIVNLQNDQVERHAHPIWNVGARIQGRDPHESRLIIGTHRDAWCFGASDPNSGTAVMLEVARVIGSMKDFGWRPLRTIEFYNWDATEYNLMGSTEFVEAIRGQSQLDAVAYINIASAVTGTTFSAAGSPALTSALAGVLPQIPDPTHENSTIQDLWGSFEDHPLPGLGGGGDYSAFQHHLGVPSLDLTFTGPFPEGSCYDTYGWIKRQDQFLQYHMTMAKILVLLILDLADTAVAPLSMAHYDLALQRWTTELETWLPETARGKVDLAPLKKAVKRAGDHIRAFDGVTGEWLLQDTNGFYTATDDWSIGLRRARTARMRNFDRHLCNEWTTEDYDRNREMYWRYWFNHMVMGPQEWGGDEPSYFPWIRDAVEKEDWSLAQDYVGKVSQLIERAARKLLDEDKPSPPSSE